MEILLRDAAETDLPLLARMNRPLIEDEHSRNPMGLDELAARMKRWMDEHWSVKLFVDAVTGAVVGYALYQERADEYFPDQRNVYLRQMFVEREQRGGGIGQQALDRLVADCFPPGCTVMIDVLDANPRGAKFWRKAGFVPQYTRMHLDLKLIQPNHESRVTDNG
jgi:GNAT superfamily N-acetyltransferase